MTERARGWVVFLLPLAVYLSTGNVQEAGDNFPSRYLPFSILREGNFDLDEFPELRGPAATQTPYYLRLRDGHLISSFSPGPALLALPVYALPVAAGVRSDSRWPARLEKLTASVVVALSVLFVYQALRRTTTVDVALGVAGIYAFGTSCSSLSSQALWEHGPAQLFLALALRELVAVGEGATLLPLALGAAVVMRPTSVLLAAPLAAWAVGRGPRRAWLFAALGLVPLLPLLAYNHVHFGAPWSSGRDAILTGATWSPAPLAGLAGLLVSPARGLFVHSPVLLLAAAGLAIGCARGLPPFRAIAVGIGLLVAGCSVRLMWWGGWCFGPRLLAELLPLLAFALYPVAEAARGARWLRALLLGLAAASVLIHALGALFWDATWDRRAQAERHHERLWSWTRSPVADCAREAASLPRRLLAGATLRARRLATSRDTPAGLAASYTLLDSVPLAAPRRGALTVGLRATNTGRSAWLARPVESPGAVRLAWDWSCDGVALEAPWGREDLRYPVLPGESYTFELWGEAPESAGNCVLTLGLVSEQVARFGDVGTPPLHFEVEVVPSKVK